MRTSAAILPSATALGVRTERRGVDFPDPVWRAGGWSTMPTNPTVLEATWTPLPITGDHTKTLDHVMVGYNPELCIEDPVHCTQRSYLDPLEHESISTRYTKIPNTTSE